ncbi:MAG: metal-dependent hydrolase [Chloroflexi bacterium]|jgi:membrane-bound metal-dependent hydrolase YbcI (DUF457 family)|nr:metal-dependent hydrolase [Chloroflexota bacterium]MBT3670969.1 metal-dependent hydrolase [Chloroflexota bacterium]MBT4002307.1 metal-dependent hydrolase [Chloroflexota bacterium]MBT4306317.1 metal-dependent hydrolase [Chloroflexota bacterium]MBT4532802.1 metal-dependent hydrolase [Chloroflexota bacterium]
MPQAGIHALSGTMVSRFVPKKEWFMLGIVFGTIFPDTDNLAVAVATVTGGATEGLHRTFTHSIIVIVGLILLFNIIGKAVKKQKISNFGTGLGIGMIMHILFDLIIWFNGVEVLWPFGGWVNFWESASPSKWWMDLMMTAEFLFFGLFFFWLYQTAKKHNTNSDSLPNLKIHIYVQMTLFVIFTVLVYVMKSGFMTPYGALYLVSLGIAYYFVFKMKETVERITSS